MGPAIDCETYPMMRPIDSVLGLVPGVPPDGCLRARREMVEATLFQLLLAKVIQTLQTAGVVTRPMVTRAPNTDIFGAHAVHYEGPR